MTAIDIASQVKRLGADDVTIVYRRGPESMTASRKEQAGRRPAACASNMGAPAAAAGPRRCTHLRWNSSRRGSTVADASRRRDKFIVAADMVFKAIGQMLIKDGLEGNAAGSK